MCPMYYHSYGSLPGRGAISNRKKGTKGGKQAVERYIKKHSNEQIYYLKLDIHKFFDNVSHEVLKKQFARIIRDQKFLKLLYTIIDVTPDNKGIPIGFYTSQWFANFYLIKLDHYIKEVLHADFYIRYMDDMVIFSDNKTNLHQMKIAIEAYLKDELKLELNPKYIITPLDKHFLDFMGFRFYLTHTTLRRALSLRIKRKARKIGNKTLITIYDCRQMLAYKGWVFAAKSYYFYNKYIRPYVTFYDLAHYISYLQRRLNDVVSYSEWDGNLAAST